MGQIDLAHFNKIALGNKAFSVEIIDRFLQQSQEYQPRLEAAVKAGDFRSVKGVMQQLKSQALVFGATELVGLISRIEKASVDKFEQYSDVVFAAKSHFEELIKEAQSSKDILLA